MKLAHRTPKLLGEDRALFQILGANPQPRNWFES
jgi:hypothetical protein